MKQRQFKELYSKFRKISFDADNSARGKPCGTDDMIYEIYAEHGRKMCESFPILDVVYENSLAQDELETPIYWRLHLYKKRG